jgi:hypothetical protein
MSASAPNGAIDSKVILDGAALDQAGELEWGEGAPLASAAAGQHEALVLVPEKKDPLVADQGPDGPLVLALGAAVVGVGGLVLYQKFFGHRDS